MAPRPLEPPHPVPMSKEKTITERALCTLAGVFGCTEVPLVLDPADLDAPLVDSTDVLVAAALAFARPG